MNRSSRATASSASSPSGSFDEMAAVVIFVHAHVCPSFFRELQAVISINVTIRLLRCGDEIDPVIRLFLHCSIWLVLE